MRRLARGAADAVVALAVLAAELVRPLYRPLVRRFAALRVVRRLELLVGRLPPYAILALLAVPFTVAEPAKLAALVLIARGAVAAGLAVMALAYVVSFLLVERIYHAGHDGLMCIGWFAALMVRLARTRAAVLARLRALPVWALAHAAAARIRGWFAGERG